MNLDNVVQIRCTRRGHISLRFFFFTEGIGVYYSNYYMALWQKSWNNGD